MLSMVRSEKIHLIIDNFFFINICRFTFHNSFACIHHICVAYKTIILYITNPCVCNHIKLESNSKSITKSNVTAWEMFVTMTLCPRNENMQTTTLPSMFYPNKLIFFSWVYSLLIILTSFLCAILTSSLPF